MPLLTSDLQTVISEANAALEQEDNVCSQEIEALQAFHERARLIMTGAGRPADMVETSSVNAPLASRSSPVFVSGKERRSQLLTAYQETVMSVPATEAFESGVREHMAVELGEDTTEAIYARSGPSTGVMPVLRGRVSAAIRQRQEMRRHVDVEAQSLNHLGDGLREIYDVIPPSSDCFTVSEFDELVTLDHRLADSLEKCHEALAQRQEYLQADFKDQTLCCEFISFLYADCRFRFPVLTILAELFPAIQQQRRDLARAVANY